MMTFVIPEDYQSRILDSHCELAKAYDDIKAKEEDRPLEQRNRLTKVLFEEVELDSCGRVGAV